MTTNHSMICLIKINLNCCCLMWLKNLTLKKCMNGIKIIRSFSKAKDLEMFKNTLFLTWLKRMESWNTCIKWPKRILVLRHSQMYKIWLWVFWRTKFTLNRGKLKISTKERFSKVSKNYNNKTAFKGSINSLKKP